MPERITPADATDVLKIASVYDGRKTSELQSTVWAADLGDHGISAEEAARAVREHYTERPDVYIKPGHVIAIARDWARERAERERTAAFLAEAKEREIEAKAPGPRVDLRAMVRKATEDYVAAQKAKDPNYVHRPPVPPWVRNGARPADEPFTRRPEGDDPVASRMAAALDDVLGRGACDDRPATPEDVVCICTIEQVPGRFPRIVDREPECPVHSRQGFLLDVGYVAPDRQGKIPHPSGNDGGDGMAWAPEATGE